MDDLNIKSAGTLNHRLCAAVAGFGLSKGGIGHHAIPWICQCIEMQLLLNLYNLLTIPCSHKKFTVLTH